MADGKTSFGPHWLYREIQRCGPGDYLIASPTFVLAEKKLIPELLLLFKEWLKLGDYNKSSHCFTFARHVSMRTFRNADKPTNVWIGAADHPNSLESATVKAAWLDEPGQKEFRLDSWHAILRRLSLAQGRALLTTTPYDLGWLKQHIYDRWKRINSPLEKPGDRDFRVIRFDSTENPQFPQEEFERARNSIP